MRTTSELPTAPASYAQQRVWLAEQLDGTPERYNVQVGLRFRGRLDRPALNWAVTELVRRHEVLRTSLRMDEGEVIQVITPPAPVTLPLTDLADTADAAAELERHARAEISAPFIPADAPFFRAALFKLADDDHVLLITMDHAMADPWSVGILDDELTRLYIVGPAAGTLDELPIQYADFAYWQRDLLEGGHLDAQLSYWRGVLGDDPPLLALPAVGTRRTRTAAQLARSLPAGLMSALADMSRAADSSLFMTLFTGYAVLLGRYAEQDDVLIGTLLTGRTQPETSGLIGFFANVAVLRTDLSGQPSFREVLRRVRKTALNAYANQDVPFQHVASELKNSHSTGDRPFFDTMFQLADLRRAPAEGRGVRIEPFRAANQPTPVELAVTVVQEADRTVALCDYDTGLFDEQAVERILDHYVIVLETMTADPDAGIAEQELLTSADRRWLASAPAARSVPADWTFATWFGGLAREFGGNLAVDDGTTRLTYAELNARANRVAHALRGRGVTPESVVGILLERGVDLVTSMLGTLKAGAAYLPLDPGYPADRLRYMIDDARPGWIITTSKGNHPPGGGFAETDIEDLAIPAGTDAEADPAPIAMADNLAYVIYTSGSTGRPKGVAVSHRGLKIITDAQREVFALSARDRVPQWASPSFDASLWEMMLAFGAGATLCLPSSRDVARSTLADLLRTHRATAVFSPPAALSVLSEEPAVPGLRTIVTGGDMCPPHVARHWSATVSLFNVYGPTEATIWSTVQAIGPGTVTDTVPIGRPVSGAVAEVLDSHGRRAPLGAPGELHLGGEIVARGYLRRPGMTADRFIPDAFSGRPGGRLYRTGDLVRWRHDGTLEFLGRIDRQVKLRGFRIELGEIEARLTSHPAVRDALVMLREDVANRPVLAAYLVAADGQRLTLAEVGQHCAATLPGYMVPGAWVILDRLPVDPNGKVDRSALPTPGDPEDGAEYVAPRGQLEESLAKVWREVLGHDRVSVFADFFELGGDSLAATRVTARIRRDFGLAVPVQVIFENRTLVEFSRAVADLAALADGAEAGGGEPSA
jgi:amino acid adenylation domain-containing protein